MPIPRQRRPPNSTGAYQLILALHLQGLCIWYLRTSYAGLAEQISSEAHATAAPIEPPKGAQIGPHFLVPGTLPEPAGKSANLGLRDPLPE